MTGMCGVCVQSWQSAAQHPAEQALPTESIVDMLHQEMDPCKVCQGSKY